MTDCIFCKIASKEIPSETIYEDDKVIAFMDLNPQAPKHILVIPRKHIESANDIDKDNADIIGHIFVVIAELAEEHGFKEEGYRIVNNVGENGQQTVAHLHYHVLAGRKLTWPPG